MRTALAALALVPFALVPFALALVAPAAHAQSAQTAPTLMVGTVNDPIPYMGNASLPVTVTVGCQYVIEGAAANQADHTKAVVTVAAPSPPDWLTVAPATLALDLAACPPAGAAGGYLTKSGAVGLRVAASAPGVVRHSVNLTATMPGLQAPYASTQSGDFNVTYHANHTVTADLQFPYTMTGRTLNFTVTVTLGANARSMVMFEQPKASPGSFSGLASMAYEPGQARTFKVTYAGPDAPWTEARITFHEYSHYLINGTSQAGGANLARDVAWVIRNGNPGGEPGGAPGTSKASPLAAAPLLAALAGAAVLARKAKR